MFLRRRRIAVLLLGDVFLFYVALAATIGVSFPPEEVLGVFMEHVVPFSYLFVLWVIVFFIAGLYDKETLFFRRKLPAVLFNTQLVNSVLAAVFFYLLPIFKIAPKTNLFIYLVISFLLMLAWRLYGVLFFSGGKKQKALIAGAGSDFEELVQEIKNNARYNIEIERIVDLADTAHAPSPASLEKEVPTKGISVVILDMNNAKTEILLPRLYNMLFSGIRFFDLHTVYEEVFNRVPLSLLYYRWFLRNVSPAAHGMYDYLKRLMDVVLSVLLGLLSLPLYPLIALAIFLEDGAPIFITQKRIGRHMASVHLYKFRSMERSEDGVWVGETENKITRVGAFLRKTRLDELPQFWNILRGDLSFVGPRPDISGLGEKLLKEIPYYNIRYTVKPGLSGWAQINQDIVPQSVKESKERLAYDLYYIKNRSFVLDIYIALKTVKTLVSRTGR